MNDSPEKISPLRRRMIEDMRMRKLSLKTQSTYIRAVRHFAGYLGRSPDTATDEDLRRYQLHCVDRGISPITLNATITGLRFFFEVTLKRPELMSKMSHIRVVRTLPVVLSREEASRLIESASTLKHRTALSVAYGAGLRVSEVCALKVGDIDSKRDAVAHREVGAKGQKDRYALLPPIMLERCCAPGGATHGPRSKVLPGGYLFPGLDPMDSLSTRQLRTARCTRRRSAAHIEKRVSMHTLRHSFATHLLGARREHPHHPSAAWTQEASETTALYTQVASRKDLAARS